jgi:hypothetical protein
MRDAYGKEIEELLKLGLLEEHEFSSSNGREGRGEGEVFRLTQRGRLLGNQAFMRFVD